MDRNKGIVNITIDKKYFTSSMVYIYGNKMMEYGEFYSLSRVALVKSLFHTMNVS